MGGEVETTNSYPNGYKIVIWRTTLLTQDIDFGRQLNFFFDKYNTYRPPRDFINKYNTYTPYKELDYLTPMDYYNGRMVKVG
jgi:hypothetical protein